MLYRILRFVNEWYAVVVLWVFIGAFALALSFMFVFPQVTLGLFFVGLLTLGVAVVASGILQSILRLLARRTLSAGRCPRCGSRGLEPISHGQAAVQCPNCQAMFTPSGGEVELHPHDDTPDASVHDRVE